MMRFHLVVNHWVNRRGAGASDHARQRSDGDHRHHRFRYRRLSHWRFGEYGHLG